MSRAYVAGPMTGIEAFNYPAFHAAAAELRAAGFDVLNPAEGDELPTWAAYMRRGLAQMLTCDEVVLLPGWERSKGAGIERDLAVRLGMRVRMLGEVVA